MRGRAERRREPASILLVEDKDSLRRLLTVALEGEGHRVTATVSVEEARRNLERGHDFILTDLKLPDGTGLDVLETASRDQPSVPVVVMTAFGTVKTAVDAMKLGAVDFLEKPVELDDLFAMVERLVAAPHAPAMFQPPGDAPPIVGRHPRLRAALRLLEKVAATDSTVLITGESGTGKELFARALHALSARSGGPFVAVNCAAIPEALMENELFGHEKGAFTGASRRQAGRFEQAGNGTLFLDEIGDLELDVQGKVLRVLEERVFERVGGGRPIRADARIVAATNRDLGAMVKAQRFRQDLWYRLDVFPIELPPLRSRASDIPEIAHFLVRKICLKLGRAAPGFSPGLLERLEREPWPGNVRQLANLMERALILCEANTLQLEDVEPFLGSTDDLETRLREALKAADGDKREAAERLGISYRTLQRRIRELDLEGYPRYRS